jgi:hypothetical protein
VKHLLINNLTGVTEKRKKKEIENKIKGVTFSSEVKGSEFAPVTRKMHFEFGPAVVIQLNVC